MMPPKKIDVLRGYMAAERWKDALRLANTFGQLGAEKVAITKGWAALTRPEFYRSIGKDPDALVAAGIAALKRRYDLA